MIQTYLVWFTLNFLATLLLSVIFTRQRKSTCLFFFPVLATFTRNRWQCHKEHLRTKGCRRSILHSLDIHNKIGPIICLLRIQNCRNTTKCFILRYPRSIVDKLQTVTVAGDGSVGGGIVYLLFCLFIFFPMLP